MSCTFWLRRHNAAARKRKEERLKAEAEQKKTTEEKVFGEEPVIEVKEPTKKPRKRAVKTDDNA